MVYEVSALGSHKLALHDRDGLFSKNLHWCSSKERNSNTSRMAFLWWTLVKSKLIRHKHLGKSIWGEKSYMNDGD